LKQIDLSGKVAVVTGAGANIGIVIADYLAECGADLMLHYRTSRPQLKELIAKCAQLGRRVEVVSTDFSADPGQAAEVVDQAVSRLGRVDILVNNAAVTTKNGSVEVLTRQLFEEIIDVNLTAVFLASQAAAKHMIARGTGGRIINISSIMAQQTSLRSLAYETSKGAINSLTFSLAVELGKYGITANAVAPGAVWTENYKDNTNYEESWYKSRIPLGRLGEPVDIAGLVAFLASEEASYISGQVILVDGAMSRRLPVTR
jgi:NAD(P)-dependent dehydrogenase (short-subunit alcohol dehydrogenase family)